MSGMQSQQSQQQPVFTGNASPARRSNPAAEAVQQHRADVQQNLYNQPVPVQPQLQPPIQTPELAPYPQQMQLQGQAQYVPQPPIQQPPLPVMEPSFSGVPVPQYGAPSSGVPVAQNGLPTVPPLPEAMVYDKSRDPDYLAVQKELELERLKRQQMEAERAELDKIRAEMAVLKQEAELAKIMQFKDDDLDLTNPTDLRNKVLAPLVSNLNNQYKSQFDAIQKDNAELRAQLMKQQEQQAQTQALELKDIANQQIFARHPDFYNIRNSQAWAQLMQMRTPHGRTYNEVVIDEYRKGNGQYVSQLIDYVKGQQPQANMMATVSPVMTAQAPPINQQQEISGTLSHDQLAQLRQEARASGDRAAFQKAMAQHREAKKRASVH